MHLGLWWLWCACPLLCHACADPQLPYLLAPGAVPHLRRLLPNWALAASILAYVIGRQHLLLRTKPLFEQALLVGAALLGYEALIWLIEGWLGQIRGDWTRWLGALVGAIVWPLLARLPTGRLPERT